MSNKDKEGQQTAEEGGKDRSGTEDDGSIKTTHAERETGTGEPAPDPLKESEKPEVPKLDTGGDEADPKEIDTSAAGSPGAKARADAGGTGDMDAVDSIGEDEAPKGQTTVLTDDLKHLTVADSPGFASGGAPSAVRNTPTPGIMQSIYGINEPVIQEQQRARRARPESGENDQSDKGMVKSTTQPESAKPAAKKSAAKKAAKK